MTVPTFSTDVDKSDAFALDEMQSLVDICDLVEPEFSTFRSFQLLSTDDLQEQHQLEAVSKVFGNVLDVGVDFPQMRIAPCRERLPKYNAITNINKKKEHNSYWEFYNSAFKGN